MKKAFPSSIVLKKNPLFSKKADHRKKWVDNAEQAIDRFPDARSRREGRNMKTDYLKPKC